MAQPGEKFLGVSVVVFTVLAWVSLVLQVVVGVMLIIGGGAPVPIGGVDVPARVVGLLNCVAGAVYFFMLMLAAHVIRLLVDLRSRVEKLGGSAG